MNTPRLTVEAVRSFFARVQVSPESICLDLQQLRDLAVRTYPPADPAQTLIDTYQLLHELESLIRELDGIISVSLSDSGQASS